MLNLFTRGRPRAEFQARSPDRDVDVDRLRVGGVVQALDEALQAAEAEQAGLTRRLEQVAEQASIAAGNDDEYLSRDATDRSTLSALEREMTNGENRLKDLALAIAHFKFLKAALLTRFPAYRRPSGA
jgi:hypothetical protein